MIFLKNSLAAAFPEKLLEILIKSSVFFSGAGELSDAKKVYTVEWAGSEEVKLNYGMQRKVRRWLYAALKFEFRISMPTRREIETREPSLIIIFRGNVLASEHSAQELCMRISSRKTSQLIHWF